MKRGTFFRAFILTVIVSCVIAAQFIPVSADVRQQAEPRVVTQETTSSDLPILPIDEPTPIVYPGETAVPTESTPVVSEDTPSVTIPEPEPTPVVTEPDQPDEPVETVTPVFDPEPTEPPHVCEFVLTETVEAGCVQDGYTLYTCTCGEFRKEVLPATGHNVSLYTTVEPTCTDDGYKEYKCSKCDYTERSKLSKTGHDYHSTKVEATCTENGYTLYTCAKCGNAYKDNTVKAKGHTFELIETIPSTVTKNGCKVYKCSKCGQKKEEKLPLLEGAIDTDLCGESLIEKPLPHDTNPCSKSVLDTYACRYSWIDSRAKVLVPAEYYNELYLNFKYKYRYLYDSITICIETGKDGEYYFSVGKGTDAEEAEYAQACEWAKTVIQELGITPQTRQRDAIALINEYICQHKYYKSMEKNNGTLAFSCYSEYGVCANYALEFQFLCVTCGIDCEYFISHKMNHAWNIVHFSDGTAYHVDVTYNDGRSDHTKYLLITEEKIRKDHTFDD